MLIRMGEPRDFQWACFRSLRVNACCKNGWLNQIAERGLMDDDFESVSVSHRPKNINPIAAIPILNISELGVAESRHAIRPHIRSFSGEYNKVAFWNWRPM